MAGPDALRLWTPVETSGEDWTTVAEFTVREGERVPFVLDWHPSHLPAPGPRGRVRTRWRGPSGSGRSGRGAAATRASGAEPVLSSLVALKGLTYAPTGGIVAAPTTSLPEALGGVRNWDYRFCWLRDAALTLAAFLRCGYGDEALAFQSWILRAAAGRPQRPADHVRDRRRAAAARGGARLAAGLRGLGARRDRQRRGGPVPARRLRRAVRHGYLARAAAAGARHHDRRGPPGAHLAPPAGGGRRGGVRVAGAGRGHLGGARPAPPLHALQGDGVGGLRPRDPDGRGVRAGGPGRSLARASGTRSTPRSAARPSTPTAAPSRSPTARRSWTPACCSSPRWASSRPTTSGCEGTVDAVQRELTEDGFVYRYSTGADEGTVDGLPGKEGAFLPCSFWLVDALAVDRAAGGGARAVRAAAEPPQRPRPDQRGVRRRAAGAWSGTSRRRSPTWRWWAAHSRSTPSVRPLPTPYLWVAGHSPKGLRSHPRCLAIGAFAPAEDGGVKGRARD